MHQATRLANNAQTPATDNNDPPTRLKPCCERFDCRNRAAEPAKLSEVESEVLALLKQKNAEDQLLALAEELTAELLQGKDIEEVAQSNNYDWQLEIDMSRSAAPVNRELLLAAFNRTKINSYQSVPLADGSVAILRLEKIDTGSLQTLSNDERQSIVQQLKRNYANWDMSWYLKSAMASSEITRL